MKTVNVHEAKTHLSRLLRRVVRGEEIVIARAGQPLARLVPMAAGAGIDTVLGIDEGRMSIADDFTAPLPAAVLKTFGAHAEGVPRTIEIRSTACSSRRPRWRDS